jgi:hypothetical protein
MYVCVYIYTHIPIYTKLYKSVCIYIYISVCIFISVYKSDVCVFIYVEYIYIYIYIYVYIYIDLYSLVDSHLRSSIEQD